jgi:hypothetical protein
MLEAANKTNSDQPIVTTSSDVALVPLYQVTDIRTLDRTKLLSDRISFVTSPYYPPPPKQTGQRDL